MSTDASNLQRTFVRLLFSDAEYQYFMADPLCYANARGLNESLRQLLKPCADELFAVERRGRKMLIARELSRTFLRTLVYFYPNDEPYAKILDEFMESDEFFSLGTIPSVWNGLCGYDNRPKFYNWVKKQYRYASLKEDVELDLAEYLTQLAQYSFHPYYERIQPGLLVFSDGGWLFVKNGIVIGSVRTTEALETLLGLGVQHIESLVR